MTELENYISAHAVEFDTEAPADGHQARFLARLDEAAPARTSFRTRFMAFLAKPGYLLPLACGFAALVVALLILRPGDPWRGVGNDPQAIYLAYMDRVAELYRIPSADSEQRDALLQDITEEEEPFFTQLPEGLSGRERGRILKEYYGRVLAAAREIK